ncbi:hypothetical protein CLOM_g10698 [Closterium sp. NIES-68]|nr:hypothetical protein CLOM_g10698 [Closterium sp. NIES-68]GJP69920.1 hypothetical protein CLOP_g918 [Closterium sp. NIES-67]
MRLPEKGSDLRGGGGEGGEEEGGEEAEGGKQQAGEGSGREEVSEARMEYGMDNWPHGGAPSAPLTRFCVPHWTALDCNNHCHHHHHHHHHHNHYRHHPHHLQESHHHQIRAITSWLCLFPPMSLAATAAIAAVAVSYPVLPYLCLGSILLPSLMDIRA